MIQQLQAIAELVKTTANLTETEKELLSKAIKEVDKAYTMTGFKLERMEKDKHTLSVMLEESIQDLQKKSTAIEESNKALTQTLNDLKAAQAQLIQSEKMASLGELTAGIAHEIQNPLNFVNNFSDVSTELVDEMNEEIDKGNLEDAKQIAQDLKSNLEKINHHGKRAGDIVKGMLQHSRTSSGQKELTDINALCDEYLRLAYHGLRAKDKTFNAAMKTDYDESTGLIKVIPQDFGRVVLNLITNAFYAVNERKKLHAAGYEPVVSISTKREKDKIEIKVQDNGTGIPQKILDKIFQPFFTTKPTGQGTGLGLSLSYDIVKAHGGELKVETNEGEGAIFILQLPAS
jgi:two-component system, NtrC family, sensor kinase